MLKDEDKFSMGAENGKESGSIYFKAYCTIRLHSN